MRLSDSGAYIVDDTGHVVAAREIMDTLAALRNENARLQAQISGRTLVPELVELQRENARLKAEVARLELKQTCHKERDEARDEAVAARHELRVAQADLERQIKETEKVWAEVARLEGLILAAHEGLDDYWVTLPEAQPILTEARRIRAAKGE